MRTSILALIVTLPALIGGCATATKIYDANGQEAIMIACDGSAVPMSVCYNKAASECPQGYYMLGSNNSNQGFIVSQYGANTINTKSIAVRCK